MLAVLVAGISVLTICRSQTQYQERATIVAQNLTQVLEQDISSSIIRIDLGVLAIVHEAEKQLALGRINEREINNFILWQNSLHSDVDGLRIADSNGTIVFGTGISSGPRATAADRDYFLNVRADRNAGLQVSKPVLGRINGKWIVIFARRINQPNGDFGGIAFATVTLDSFQKKFASLNLGRQGIASLRDTDMGIIVRFPSTNGPESDTGMTAVSPQFREAAGTNPDSGTYRAASGLDNVERTFSYRRIPAYPAYVFVGLATDDYMAEWRKDVQVVAVIVALFVFTSLFASWLIFRAWKRQREAIGELRKRESYQNSLLDNFPFAVWLKDRTGRYLAVNSKFADSYGWPSASSLTGKTDFDIEPAETARSSIAEDDMVLSSGTALSVERQVDLGGLRTWIEMYKSPVAVNNEAVGTVGFFRNIDERKTLEEQIGKLAFYDPLTTLANRRLLQDRLSQAIPSCARMACYGVLMFLDLDNFKPLNDAHGHDTGDLLLIEVAQRLKKCVRETDTISRFGGDEFVVMIADLDQEETASMVQAETIAKKILERLAEPYVLTLQRDGELERTIAHRCSASIGVALFSGNEANKDDILRRADAAMYQAKQREGNTVVFHAPNPGAILTGVNEAPAATQTG